MAWSRAEVPEVVGCHRRGDRRQRERRDPERGLPARRAVVRAQLWEGRETSESHPNPGLLSPAAPRMTSFVDNVEYSYAAYCESEPNVE